MSLELIHVDPEVKPGVEPVGSASSTTTWTSAAARKARRSPWTATFRLLRAASGGEPGQNTSIICSRPSQGWRWVTRYLNSSCARLLGQSATATSSRLTQN